MILYEQGKDYWIIARRFHAHRETPMIRPVAIRDMQKLLGTSGSPAVDKRIRNFIAKHSGKPGPQDLGPRTA